jgi:tRNA U34 5-methylaminomethyl-2-thiouridine-forming methyltransferase MnmC
VGRGEKKARENGWPILFIDESGYRLQPLVRRTWAPKGETPVQHSWDRHDRLSVMAGICFSPVRHRPRLFFQIHQQNIRFDAVIAFLGLVHRHVRKKFILVLDRHSAHRKAIRLLQEQHPDWMEVVWLPAYAPELNPVEMVWNHSQYGDLANFLPEGIDHLREAVSASLERMGAETALLLSCFQYTGLEW